MRRRDPRHKLTPAPPEVSHGKVSHQRGCDTRVQKLPGPPDCSRVRTAGKVVGLGNAARAKHAQHATYQRTGTKSQPAGPEIRGEATQCARYQPAENTGLVGIRGAVNGELPAHAFENFVRGATRQAMQLNQLRGGRADVGIEAPGEIRL